MGFVLFFLGLAWAVVGIINLIAVIWAEGGVLYYLLFFILPGFVVAAIGAVLRGRIQYFRFPR